MVALERWPADGTPDNPGAWITRVARNKAIDRLRREKTLQVKKEVLAGLEALEPSSEEIEEEPEPEMPDDRLRLIFTCCHPALRPQARVALTLRTLGGLTTAEIASAFLTSEATMAQRLVRAKAKIRDANIPYEVPSAEQLPERVASVLATLYLIFNEGYFASRSDALIRTELADEAIRLARVLVEMLPGDPESRALFALMLLQHSRREARLDDAGEMVLLEDQDRTLWDRAQIEEGLALVDTLTGVVGPYSIQARIAAEHARAELRRGHRLAPDRAPLRPAHPDHALTGDRAEPRNRGRDGPGAGGGPRADRLDRGARSLRPVPRQPRRPARPPGARPGGRQGLPPRPRAEHQPRAAGVPRAQDRGAGEKRLMGAGRSSLG